MRTAHLASLDLDLRGNRPKHLIYPTFRTIKFFVLLNFPTEIYPIDFGIQDKLDDC